MKDFLTSFLFGFVFMASVFACFVDDPTAKLGNNTQTITMSDSIVTVYLPNIVPKNESVKTELKNEIINGVEYKYEVSMEDKTITRKTYTKSGNSWTLTNTQTFDSSEYGIWNNQVYAIHSIITTPFTYAVEFSGFEGSEDDPVTRMCLLYLGKDGKLKILKDIKNPPYTVSSNSGEGKALFGKYSVYSTFGYGTGEILCIVAYFETANKSTHNLETLLNTKYTTPNDISGALKLGIYPNRNPI